MSARSSDPAATPEAAAGDARFFAREGPFSLSHLAGVIEAEPVGEGTRLFTGVAPLQAAGPGQVSFIDNARYRDLLGETKAGAVIVHPDIAGRVPEGSAAIVTRMPYLGWARIAGLFHPLPPPQPGIHPTALVDPSATVDPSAEIGPYCVIEAAAEIGPRCRLGMGVSVGPGVVFGADCRVGAHVTISHALIGTRVTLFPGVRIGQEGFGFAPTPTGFVTVPQLGRVILADDVEVGANTTIDRGSAQDTIVGAGTRIDNLVQIGHNVQLGRCCVIVAQVGISGSTVFEDFVQVAGQAGFAGHLRIGQGAQIGGRSGVMADVPAKAVVVGNPAQPIRQFFRQVAVLKKLAARSGKQPDDDIAGKTGSD